MAYRKRILKKKPVVSRRKTSLKSLVHKVMLKDEQPQWFSQSDNALYGTLYHNSIYTWNIFNQELWGVSAVSSNEFARTGDMIHVDHWDLNLNIQSSTATSASMYFRIIILKANPVYALAGPNNSGLGLSDIFVGGTGNRVVVNGVLDKREVTVLYDKLLTIQPYQASGLYGHNIHHRCKLNRKITYLPSTQTIKGQQYYCLFLPFITGGTSGTTAATYFAANSCMQFKNAI